MSNSRTPRLKFNRETFRKLSAGEMSGVAGGQWRSSGDGPDCNVCSTRNGIPPTQCPTFACSLHCFTEVYCDTY